MKRSSSGSLQGEGKRRRVVEAEEGEVMETEEILMLRREHRAMYKRIRQKGEDVKSLTRELDTLRGRQADHEEALFIVYEAWDRTVQDLANTAQQVDATVQAEAPLGATTETGHVHPFIKLFAPKKGGVKNEVPSTPAAACVAPQRERKEERKADVKALQEGLMSLESATKAALGRVVGCIARRQREDAALGQQLQSAVEAGQLEAAVVERSTRLATEAAALRAELAEAQVKQRDMKEDLSSYKEREMKFEHGVFEAEGETEKLRWELIKAHNEVEGLQSQIQRGTPGIVSSSSSSSSSVGVVPKAAPAAEDGEVDIKLAELEEEADQWKEISATRLTEQEGLRQQIHDLRAAMIKLETSQVPSRDAQQVFAQKEQLQAEIWDLRGKVDHAAAVADQEREGRGADERAFAEHTTKSREDFKSQVHEMQTKADSLNLQLAASEKEKTELHVKLANLAGTGFAAEDARSVQAALEVKAQAYKEELETLRASTGAAGGGPADIRVRHHLFRRLIVKQQQLEQDVSGQEGKWAAIEEGERKVRTLQAQIASERKKSTQLEGEVSLLKGATDAVSLKEQLLDATSMSEELTTLLDDLARSFEEEQEAKTTLLGKAQEAERQIAELEKQNRKVAQTHSLLRQEKDVLQSKVANESDKGKLTRTALDVERKRTTTLEEERGKLEEQVRVCKDEMRILAQSSASKKATLIKLQEDLTKATRFCAEQKKRLEQECKESEGKDSAIRDLRENFTILKRKAEMAAKRKPVDSGGGGRVDADLEAELRLAKNRLCCSVCSLRDKNTVITKCFHIFCGECIQDNLKSRHRKCPGCGVSFGDGDIRSIYIT